MNSPHKGQWRGALMFSLICIWINGWSNNREAGDLRRYRGHYDVIVMRLPHSVPTLIFFNMGIQLCKLISWIVLFFGRVGDLGWREIQTNDRNNRVVLPKEWVSQIFVQFIILQRICAPLGLNELQFGITSSSEKTTGQFLCTISGRYMWWCCFHSEWLKSPSR